MFVVLQCCDVCRWLSINLGSATAHLDLILTCVPLPIFPCCKGGIWSLVIMHLSVSGFRTRWGRAIFCTSPGSAEMRVQLLAACYLLPHYVATLLPSCLLPTMKYIPLRSYAAHHEVYPPAKLRCHTGLPWSSQL